MLTSELWQRLLHSYNLLNKSPLSADKTVSSYGHTALFLVKDAVIVLWGCFFRIHHHLDLLKTFLSDSCDLCCYKNYEMFVCQAKNVCKLNVCVVFSHFYSGILSFLFVTSQHSSQPVVKIELVGNKQVHCGNSLLLKCKFAYSFYFLYILYA